MIVKVGHHWLVHGTVPLDIARLSVAVSVHILVVLMVDWSLASSPLSVRIGHRRVLGEDAGDGPVEQIGVVDQSLGVEGMVIEDKWAVVTETTADTSNNEVADPSVGQPASHVEILDGKLADDGETEEDTSLSSRGVIGPVEIRLVSRSGDHAEIVSGEPALEHVDVVQGLGSPFELSLLKGVFRDTEANKLTILNVVRDLGVDSSSNSVIIGVLRVVFVLDNCYGIGKGLPVPPGWRASLSCSYPTCDQSQCEKKLHSSYIQY